MNDLQGTRFCSLIRTQPAQGQEIIISKHNKKLRERKNSKKTDKQDGEIKFIHFRD